MPWQVEQVGGVTPLRRRALAVACAPSAYARASARWQLAQATGATCIGWGICRIEAWQLAHGTAAWTEWASTAGWTFGAPIMPVA